MCSKATVEGAREHEGLPLGEVAGARAALYGFVLRILDKPSLEQHGWLSGEAFASTLQRACDRFGVASPARPVVPWSGDEHEAVYLACFEVGVPTAKVVLQASHHNRRAPAPRTIHEHALMYRLFGAQLAADNLDQADHLLNQVAFLIHLDALVLGGASDLRSILAARRDFIDKHVLGLVHAGRRRASASGVPAVYGAALELLACAIEEDLEVTEQWLGALPA